MSNKEEKSFISIGLTSLVFLVFLTLKLTETGVVAHWSWWWVTAPLWFPIGVAIAMIVVVFAVIIIASAVENRTLVKKRKDILKGYPNPPKTSRFQQRLDEMNKQREQNNPKCNMCGREDAQWTSTRGKVCNRCHDSLLGLD